MAVSRAGDETPRALISDAWVAALDGAAAPRSQYKGVTFDARTSVWQARITIEGRRTHLGFFSSELEAAQAFDNAERAEAKEKHRPAVVNFPGPNELSVRRKPGGPGQEDRVLWTRSSPTDPEVRPATGRGAALLGRGTDGSGPRSGPLRAPSPPSVSGGHSGDLASPMHHSGGRMPAAPASQKTWPPRRGGTRAAAAVRFA